MSVSLAYERLKERADRSVIATCAKNAYKNAQKIMATEQEMDVAVFIGQVVIAALSAPNTQVEMEAWQWSTSMQQFWNRLEAGTLLPGDYQWLDEASTPAARTEREVWREKLKRFVARIEKSDKKGKDKEKK